MFNQNGDNGAPIKVALYARVSSEEQRDNQTIRTQLETAKKWVELQELTGTSYWVFEYYQDDGVSGTIALADRPAGIKLLEDAVAGRFTMVLVYKIDRLGRDPRDILNTAYRLDQLGVAVKSLTEEFDMSSPSGRFMFNIFAASAGFARDTQVERSVAGTNYWAKQGVWLGGIVPYGYRVEGQKKQARLVVSESQLKGTSYTEAGVIRLIYKLLAQERWSCVKIAEHLNSLGIPPAYVKANRQVQKGGPEGKRMVNTAGVWTPSRIRNLVVNSVYEGVHVYGKRSTKARELISRPVAAIVDESTWDKAQTTLVYNQTIPPGTAKRQYLLRGLVRCGLCGRMFNGSEVLRPSGKRDSYYRCNGKIPARARLFGRCASRHVPAVDLEDAIWQDILGFLNDPGPVLEQLAEALSRGGIQSKGADQERRELQESLNRKAVEKDTMLDLYRRGRIAMADLDTQLDKIASEEATLRDRLLQLESQEKNHELATARLTEATDLLGSLRDRLKDEFPWEEKRELVELLVAGVVVDAVREGSDKRSEIQVTYMFDGSATTRRDMGSWPLPA